MWVHGDLDVGNLLVRDGRLSAVIDFGTLAVGDPACDLLAAWLVFPAGARDVYRAAVGADEAAWARGRGWGLAALLSLVTGADSGRGAWARGRIQELVDDLRG
ncbi:phosphotransferase [Actinomadura fibrosa]|uniref:Phosphotransferase n=1 Tax=Actinomadura fibrosa TaxID=111802 RepID=A0ABW2XCN9_9ACTN|nr:phosphotransferase [Actinomadura fibrosa]